MQQGPDAIDVLLNDHRHVEQLFEEYERATETETQTRLVHQVVHELAIHGEIEELRFYPTLREVLDDGDRLADEAITTHLELDLGESLEAARAVVPTRPHPEAPTSPHGTLTTAPPAALVDRVRDAIRSTAG